LKIRNSSGFTLIELMIVLLMLSIMITIGGAFAYKSIEQNNEIAFKSQLKKDLLNAQLTAITSGEQVFVNFYPFSQTYYIQLSTMGTENLLVKRELPSTIEFLETSTLSSFRFLPSGSTSTFGVIRFNTIDGPFSIHYYLGKGRFYVEG